MPKIAKDKLIAAYQRLVKQHGGTIIGERIFKRETGYSHHYWKGGYWRSWSGLQREAGYAPNAATQRIDDNVLLRRFAELSMELDAIPTDADLMLKRREDATFPSRMAFKKWGGRDALLVRVKQFCHETTEFASVFERLSIGTSAAIERRISSDETKGFVYLLRSGKAYKLGRSNAVGRRLRELAIQLPEKPDTVHVIETDDPEGIEQYWHRRFADKRQGGEWFLLSPDDVRAFKKRKYQ